MPPLYRPVGAEELALIRDTDFAAFPPRLPQQPFFYPVVQLEYARRIAREWNANETGAGYVTRFEVDNEYLAGHETHDVGGRECTEYWIAAEALEGFNRSIAGKIEVVDAFAGKGWHVVYDLAMDTDTIRLVQKATLAPAGFGIVPEVALFGSAPWWAAIARGDIPKLVVEGVVSRLYMTGHGDWPELELDSHGTKSTWTRMGNHSACIEGARVRVEYVVQKLRRTATEQNSVLRMLVSDSPRSTADDDSTTVR